MLKRQESSLSSSRRLSAPATPPTPEAHRARTVGCMSGIFHLFSKYHNSNKRLTFGRKRERCKKPSSPANKDKDEARKDSLSSSKEDKTENQTYFDKPSLEIKAPRSPPLPPELRRSTAGMSPENPRAPSSVVARLMGLGDIDCNTAVKGPLLEEAEYSVTEKRRRLIRALEKCNEDLEGLRMIIQAVQANEMRRLPTEERNRSGGKKEESLADKSCTEKFAAVGGSEPRALISGFAVPQNTVCPTVKTTACLLPHRKTPTASKKPGKDDNESMALFLLRSCHPPPIAISSPRGTYLAPKARSVEEVCKDITWGEKREMGRIVVVLQDYICRDLIEEVVKELKSCWTRYSLPLQGSKRRLCF